MFLTLSIVFLALPLVLLPFHQLLNCSWCSLAFWNLRHNDGFKKTKNGKGVGGEAGAPPHRGVGRISMYPLPSSCCCCCCCCCCSLVGFAVGAVVPVVLVGFVAATVWPFSFPRLCALFTYSGRKICVPLPTRHKANKAKHPTKPRRPRS